MVSDHRKHDFGSYLRSQRINNLVPIALCLRSVYLKSQLSDFDSCSGHLIHYNVPVNIHCGSDVRVAHHFCWTATEVPTASSHER